MHRIRNYHFFRCTKNTQMWNDSHNDLLEVLAREMRRAGLYTNAKELTHYQREHSLLPDLEFVCQAQMHTVDVSLTTSSFKGWSAKEQARAANEREHAKERKYSGLTSFKSSTFHPCVFERDTLSCGKRTAKLIGLIAAEAIRNGRQNTSPFLLTAFLVMTVIASTGRYVDSVISRDVTHAYERRTSRASSYNESTCVAPSPVVAALHATQTAPLATVAHAAAAVHAAAA